ncbi:Solute carrier family 25 member 40 [Hypsibius exemplaris]|uniref:Solute carrier family 25 member 40 n=1 Tax=Hypsibius exemplaris TaxID=2072580 RepID=A0A1W0WZY0_HYPEX|nr:Solute carrier family 25 member 40 [Hypsibius exemplaris]
MSTRMTMEPNGITAAQQIVASSTGAMLTSLFTTPLDVVKVRLQSQTVAAGELRARTTPLRSIPAPRFTGMFDTLLKVSRQEGVRSLWAGLSPTLVMTIPGTVLYFTTYEQVKQRLRHTRYRDNGVVVPIFAGAIARVCAVTVISPIELIRTKLQSEKLSYKYLYKAVAVTIKKEGILSIWRGWGPTVLRDVPFSCIYWGFYETFKANILSRKQLQELPVAWAFLSGATAGTIAGVATLPFDVVKTHRQIELGQLLTAKAAPIRTEATHTLALLSKLYREKGFASLFSGVTPRIAKVAPSCAIMISSYEFFRGYFRRRNATKAKTDEGPLAGKSLRTVKTPLQKSKD